MKRKIPILAGVCAVALTACIPSVNPFYSENDIVREPLLAGEWSEDPARDDAGRWIFESATQAGVYDLTVIESDGAQGKFDATLFELRNHLFLDLIATDLDLSDDTADLVGFSVFTGHLVLHVAEIEPRLRISFFEFDELGDYLEENPRALTHVIVDDRRLLTGTTRELQRFLLKHIDEGWLFDDYSDMTKLSSIN